MNEILTMRQKRANLWEAAKKFRDAHLGEDGMMSAEDAQTYDRMVDDVDRMKHEIDRLERQDAIENEMNRPISVPITNKPEANMPIEQPARPTGTSAYSNAFWQLIRSKSVPFEVYNSLKIGEDDHGGYLAPDEFVRPERAMFEVA